MTPSSHPDFDRLTEIFLAAREAPAEQRGRLLDEACGGDRALRDEVESLLAADAAAGRFLEVPAAVAAGLVEAEEDPLKPGTRLGSYKVERELGRGGMGIVYLAEDDRLGRKVAIKLLAPTFTSDARRRERLRQEARAAAALAHPGIATIYALEEIDGRLCLVGEYVRGETLRAEIERGPAEPSTLLDTAIQLARALAAAHAVGVVHRDLKPENVMRDETGRVRILDFGVARIEGQPSLDVQRLTSAGALIGTPAYMSPERLDGTDADARSDVFGLGVLLCELASGRHPFQAATPASTAVRVLSADPADLADLQPAGLQPILRRCLAKSPADRYQSAAAVARDLETLHYAIASGRTGVSPVGSGVSPVGPDVSPVESGVPPVIRSGLSPVGAATAPAALRWWVLHQVVVMAVAALVVWPVASVYSTNRDDWALALLLSVIATAVVNGTLRAHLLFLAAFDVAELRAQLARTGPWLHRSDRLFAVLLLLSGMPTVRSHVFRSALLAGVAVGWSVASLVIEPATRRAAFREADSH